MCSFWRVWFAIKVDLLYKDGLWLLLAYIHPHSPWAPMNHNGDMYSPAWPAHKENSFRGIIYLNILVICFGWVSSYDFRLPFGLYDTVHGWDFLAPPLGPISGILIVSTFPSFPSYYAKYPFLLRRRFVCAISFQYFLRMLETITLRFAIETSQCFRRRWANIRRIQYEGIKYLASGISIE